MSSAERELPGQTVLVAGLGVSGRASADYLRGIGAHVVTYDDRAKDADWTSADQVDLSAVDIVLASPGLPPHHSVLSDAAQRGMPIWSDVELAWRARVPNAQTGQPAPWLVLTGTNGKTTTVGMLTSILRASGRNAAEVGNVGLPVISVVTNPSIDAFAVELSSSQLHFIHTMEPQAAAVLNLAPDHITWHGSIDAYWQAKGRIYTGTERACVYSAADPNTRHLVEEADVQDGARAVGFGTEIPAPGDFGVVDDALVDRAFDDQGQRAGRGVATEIATFADLVQLAGPDGQVAQHIVANALAAAALARAAGTPASAVAAGLQSFSAVPHRIQRVGVIGEITFFNDSKATNTHAATASLRAFAPGSVVWIAGGLAKGEDFDDFIKDHIGRLAAVVLIGVDREPIRQALSRHAPLIPTIEIEDGDTGTVMQRAVAAAFDMARDGNTVLLAPACASMDQFKSYEDRGEQFAHCVQELMTAQH